MTARPPSRFAVHMMNGVSNTAPVHPVLNNDLQGGLDAAMRKISERHAKYSLSGCWSIIATLRAVAQTLRLNIGEAEAIFGDAIDRDGSTWTQHDHYCGFLQLATHPGHILSEYTDVEEVAVHRLFAAIHLTLFGTLTECAPNSGELNRQQTCSGCATARDANYGVLQRVAWAARDGHLEPSYVPPTPDQIHDRLMSGDCIFGSLYRRGAAEGKTPFYKTPAAWLRYNGCVPAHVQAAS